MENQADIVEKKTKLHKNVVKKTGSVKRITDNQKRWLKARDAELDQTNLIDKLLAGQEINQSKQVQTWMDTTIDMITETKM